MISKRSFAKNDLSSIDFMTSDLTLTLQWFASLLIHLLPDYMDGPGGRVLGDWHLRAN